MHPDIGLSVSCRYGSDGKLFLAGIASAVNLEFFFAAVDNLI